MNKEQLIEQLADLEHERWSSWMRHMFDSWTEGNINRWKQQMITPYSELPEHSKESDRKEARNTMKIVEPYIDQLEEKISHLRTECAPFQAQIDQRKIAGLYEYD